LVDQLLAGKNIALITDAGTPGISDPGFLLIRECVKNNVKVETLPGATAFVPALVNSGLPANRFIFEGFLPLKKGRHTLLTQLAVEERTLIFYESPMRLVKTLSDCIQYFGAARQCSVSRELTKMFEENARGTLEEVHAYFKGKTVKGEIVLVIQGNVS
jgi:16S rRNA (cytidine1402-2'-O)-methyltransferase